MSTEKHYKYIRKVFLLKNWKAILKFKNRADWIDYIVSEIPNLSQKLELEYYNTDFGEGVYVSGQDTFFRLSRQEYDNIFSQIIVACSDIIPLSQEIRRTGCFYLRDNWRATLDAKMCNSSISQRTYNYLKYNFEAMDSAVACVGPSKILTEVCFMKDDSIIINASPNFKIYKSTLFYTFFKKYKAEEGIISYQKKGEGEMKKRTKRREIGTGKTEKDIQCDPRMINGLIKEVIFNDPATIILWKNGDKTVVKAHQETYDPEKGFAMALCKYFMGNTRHYYEEVFGKHNEETKYRERQQELAEIDQQIEGLYDKRDRVKGLQTEGK